MQANHTMIVCSASSRMRVHLCIRVGLQDLGLKACLLNTQYRMHHQIAAFPSAQFYEGRVKSGADPDSRAGKALGVQSASVVHDPAVFKIPRPALSVPVAVIHK